MKDVISVDSNSKSEDTPEPYTPHRIGLHSDDRPYSGEPLCYCDKPQDTSLTKITAEYFMATDPDRVALQRKVLAWHKAERAKLFEQIRSEVIGDFDAHKAMKPQTMRIGNNGQIDHEWTDQDEDWKTIMIRDTLRVKQLEALTRLEQK